MFGRILHITPEEREEHLKSCEKKQKHLRACPICHKLSYFVIPSVIWYSSKEEKQDIVDSYKAKLNIRSSQAHTLGDITGPLHEGPLHKDLVLWMTLFDMFNSIEELTASETALDPMEELTSLEMALLLRDLILDTSDSSSDEEDFYSP